MAVIGSRDTARGTVTAGMGMALAGLGVEASSLRRGGGSLVDEEPDSPNVTLSSSKRRCKWRHWFGVGGVGLYEGALGRRRGAYRPSQSCLMRLTSHRRFCPVCREALVLAMLQHVRLIDQVEPSGNVVETFAPRENVFQATPIPVRGRNLFKYYWRVNDKSVDEKKLKTPNRLVFAEGEMKPGEYTIKLKVLHKTSFVRKDPGKYLQDGFVWKVTVRQ